MRSKHLTEVAFLGFAGNRLTDRAHQAVKEHLADCARCREEFAKFQLAHSVVERVVEIGYREISDEMPQALSTTPSKEFVFPWKVATAITVGCICMIAFLLSPRTMPTVSAAELLANAVQYEDHAGDIKPFRIQVSGQTCASGSTSEKIASFDRSVRCGRALQQIQNSPWGHGNPLSARTYLTWHNSLHQHKDDVKKQNESWAITTTTEESNVRAANLELRTSDYHATKLTLNFENDEEVSISEAPDPSSVTPKLLANNPSIETAKPADDPSDLLEVRAWTTLHRLNADTGWEAVVLRDGAGVRVKAIVHDDARSTEFINAFAKYPAIALDIRPASNPGDISDVFPDRIKLAQDAAPLAKEWLKQQFPTADQRADFSNRVLHSSQAILGRTFIIDRLKYRQVALAQCSCAKSIAALASTEKQELNSLQISLSNDLEPFLGSPAVAPATELTFVKARQLDVFLQELLWLSSSATHETFDERVEQVRRLLFSN